MLSIRMQRIGRKGHPTYRVVVQDSRWAPTSGKFVAQLGSYDPHTKTTTLVKEKTEVFLKNGAQPSERVVKLLTSEGVKMPKWVLKPAKQKRAIKTPDKLRRNRPPEEKAPEPVPEAVVEAAEEPAEAPAAAAPEVEVVAAAIETAAADAPATETPAEEVTAEPEAEEAPKEDEKSDQETPAEPEAETPKTEAEKPAESAEEEVEDAKETEDSKDESKEKA